MMDDKHLPHESQCPHGHTRPEKAGAWKIGYWILGIGSLLWLLLRSGTKPRRLAYPCQRVAAANSVGFLAYLAALLSSATLLRRLKATFTPFRLFLFVVGLLLTVVLQSSVTAPTAPILAASPTLPAWTSDSAVSNVFAITNVPEPQYTLDGGSIPSGVSPAEALHDDGVDALVTLMEAHGDYFYQTTDHPTGIFAADDVIVIKINNQWDGRNGTNSDVLKGVIYRLVQHPENFTGAVIVAENSQGANPDWYNQTGGNNSQFQDQSYQDVVQAFAGQGYHVCLANWDALRATSVDDYDAGDNDAGYVFEDADDTAEEQNHRRLSYPKFDIACNGLNLAVSMKQGLWNGSSFDADHLKMINLPVLKRHNSAWATIAMKNYLGFITTYDAGVRWVSPGYKHCWLMGQMDNSDTCNTYTNEYGLIGRQMARIRRADLDIVDAIWVNPRDNASYHARARRQDVLLASRDPFAVDYYASEFILAPLIQTYEPTLDYTQAQASTHGGWFRRGLLANVARLRTEGITDTINIDDSMTREEELAQFNAYVADANAPAVPTLTLTAPNGGETWTIGDQAQITWTSTNLSGDVHLEYSTDGFATSPHTIAAATSNDGAYTWLVPDDPSTTVMVRVGSTVTATISDTSDAVFTIAAPPPPPSPTLTLIAPNGGESWEIGSRQPIRWTSTNLSGDVRLDYSTDGFATAYTITAAISDTGIYTWTVPNTPSESALVRVSSALTATISDTSDAVFTIAAPPPPPSPTLTLIAPNGGESWEIGSRQPIRWTSTNLSGDVRLDYSTDGFATAYTITAAISDTGIYTWTVPNTPSESALVRVSSALTATISDTSDAPFTIRGPWAFEDAFKRVWPEDVQSGEQMTYTIVLYEALQATLTLTDVLPAPLTYVTGSVRVDPVGHGTLLPPGTAIRWTGVVTGGQPVTITFQANVPTSIGSAALPVVNRALVSRDGAAPVELTATVWVNAYRIYLPVVLRSF